MIYAVALSFRCILRENGVLDDLQVKLSSEGIPTKQLFWSRGRDKEGIKEWINCWVSEEDEKTQDALLLDWSSVRRRVKKLSDEVPGDHIRMWMFFQLFCDNCD